MTTSIIVTIADKIYPMLKETIEERDLKITYSDSYYCLLESTYIVVRIMLETNGKYTVKVNGHEHKEVEEELLNDLITTELQIP